MNRRVTPRAVTLVFFLVVGSGSGVAHAADETSTPPPPSSAAPSPEAKPPAFGARGGLVIGSDASGSVIERISSGMHSLSVDLNPAVDYFVADHFSIGASLWFAYASGSDSTSHYHETVLGIGPRIGYDIPISEHISLWPRVYGFVSHSHDSFVNDTPASGTTYDTTSLTVAAFVPLLFHPTPHFFVGVGPYAEGTANLGPGPGLGSTLVGGRITLGGWVGP